MSALMARSMDEWSLICSDSFVPLSASGPPLFHGTIDHVQLGAVGVSRVRCGESAVSRSAGLIAREPRDDLLLSIQIAGTGDVQQSDRVARLRPGAGAVYSADREYRLEFGGPMEELVLQVPRARLRLREATVRDTTARTLAPGNAALTVLRHYLAGVLSMGDPHAAEREIFGETALDLLTVALRADPPGSRSGTRSLGATAILASVKDDLRRAFGDPDLSLEDIAQAHSISRRYLDQIFAADGSSPASYLRTVRLEESRRLLRGDAAHTVAAVGYTVGFRDVTTFIRAFRREFGVTPDQWRREVD